MTLEPAWMRIRTTSLRRRRAIAITSLLTATLIAGASRAQFTHAHGSYNDLLHDEAVAKRAAAKPAPPAPASDGLSGGGFYLEADQVTRREDQHHVEADGHVQARYQGRTLRADHVDYDTDKGEVVATGHVQILGDDGSAQFADKLSLDKTMNAGFATGFSTRLEEHVQIAAASATRRSRDVTVLEHVIYTPCQVCEVGGARQPSWSIRARRVVEDKARQTIVSTTP